ncbi:transmembrane reductase CYB561D2-like [Ochlerotatus camptorhynchus]|uniref:transmembrane reductase CYB561D2-like n=1 Tax=Ochlerotatus camptorhynchus TaxID=644619 RepID=UPI0031E2E61D
MAGTDKPEQNSVESVVKYVEALFNTINHMLIGYVTIYLSYLTYLNGFKGVLTWHMFLCAVGYHFFMAESFLTLYSSNSWTMQNAIDTKRRLHWMLQLIGCIAIFVGIGIEIKDKDDAKRSHFKSDHAITGLVSMVFICLSMLNGLASLYAVKIRHIIKPVYIKLTHYLCGIVAFVVGMVSLMLEYSPRRLQTAENANMLTVFSSVVVVLTVIGAMKTMYGQLKGVCR